MSYSPAGNVGWAAGSYAGAVLAPWFVAGGARGAPRSLSRAALGALLPSAALLLGVHDPWLPVYGVILVAPLQSAGAVLGLNDR